MFPGVFFILSSTFNQGGGGAWGEGEKRRKGKKLEPNPGVLGHHRFTDDHNSDLTGAFPQGRAFAHEENRLAGRSPQL
jgi:hypothetical protein